MFNQKPKKKQKNKKKPKNFLSQLWGGIFLLMMLVVLTSFVFEDQKQKEEINLSQVATFVESGDVSKITVQGNTLELTLFDDEEIIYESKKEGEVSLTETLVNYGVSPEALKSIEIDIKSESGFLYWFGRLVPVLAPIIFILVLLWFLSRSAKGSGMQMFSFGQSRAQILDPNGKNRVTFKDVAGVAEAKKELEEVVDFLRHPKKFIEIGAQIPKGVLLEGPPGTGKTLLARAVAGEARVPFFHLSGSDFVEMFVGVGASRVRDLFKMAKRSAPAIVFIDEIDAVGRKRGSGVGGGNDEREQTLNQILTEMDGFEQNQKVIVMAATNRADVLDNALLRPGRFDRRVHVDLPDRKDREAILKIHARKKPLEKDVKIETIATRTPGFSGADLQSLMNEAAIKAAREERKTVAQLDLIDAIEKVMIGPERRSKVFSEEERKITAYHEAGHALVGAVLPNADPIHKVTIVPRGRGGGFTWHLPLEEKSYHSKKNFIDDIAMSMAGYAAEELIMGDITTGPSNDIQVTTRLARSMVTKWGMSDAIGPIALEGKDSEVMYGRGMGDKEYSEEVGKIVDEEVKKLIMNGLETARRVVREKKEVLDAIANELLDKETLEQDEFNQLIKKFGIQPKEKKEEKPKVEKKEEKLDTKNEK